MAKQKFDLEKTLKVIESNGGSISDVARALKVDRATVWRGRKKYSSVAQAFEDSLETHLDLAESQLVKSVKDGRPWAVCFFLKTKGRARGYIERSESLIKSQVKVESAEDARDSIDELIAEYSDEQLLAIIKGSRITEKLY